MELTVHEDNNFNEYAHNKSAKIHQAKTDRTVKRIDNSYYYITIRNLTEGEQSQSIDTSDFHDCGLWWI